MFLVVERGSITVKHLFRAPNYSSLRLHLVQMTVRAAVTRQSSAVTAAGRRQRVPRLCCVTFFERNRHSATWHIHKSRRADCCRKVHVAGVTVRTTSGACLACRCVFIVAVAFKQPHCCSRRTNHRASASVVVSTPPYRALQMQCVCVSVLRLKAGSR